MDTSEMLQAHYAFRDRVVDDLVTDLQGPAAEDEVLDEAPLDHYLTGILWPLPKDQEDIPTDASIQDDTLSEAADGDSASYDSPVAGSRMTAPSSFGLTFTVDPHFAATVRITPHAARYRPVDPEPLDGTASDSGDEGSRNGRWARVVESLPSIDIDLTQAGGVPDRHPMADGGLELYVIARKPTADHGLVTVTAVLHNMARKPPSGELQDGHAWFQVSLEATTDVPAVVDRRSVDPHLPADPDLRSSALLYRNSHAFAAGHGCSVEWDAGDDVDGRVPTVRTVFVPRAEVDRARPAKTTGSLSIGFLATFPRDEVLTQLDLLTAQYETWIDGRRSGVRATGTPDHVESDTLRDTAEEHLDHAEEALGRIRNGITLLREDDQAFEAFQLMNRAMHEQRSRQDWVRSGRAQPYELHEQTWYPFQIAFVLLNLPSLTDRDSPEREIADLLWFPAGGGKTEAYLGLIAYLIVLRRLRDRHVQGTAVIMRYTLRLLTIQQFERASMLICALENLRRSATDRLGEERFGIGLWVGAASTPNTVDQARASLVKLRNGKEIETQNPMQLKTCPWCGTRLREDQYILPKGADRLVIRCADPSCTFSHADGLPVHVVDEDVYRERPELVIGTVDKFAQMTSNGTIATLFGREERTDIGPDLIIQDELHLISGPLGSTVGLYETAVDLAAGRTGEDGGRHRPKLIASTATIRRSEQQIRSVFDRGSRLFPPPGLNPDASFFAEPAKKDQIGNREYVGVMAPGTSQTTLMVRVYASLLRTAAGARGTVPDEVIDPYWTLIGYFNSLRVLGSAYLQVQDDVVKRFALLAGRHPGTQDREVGKNLEELTSRQPSSKIPGTLKQLETGLTDPSREEPLDVVLATNMISVGLDVDRLGLMTVMGQPPSSSEYIQATSRVGRKHPGLVVTIFNAAKSRDRSHYESFVDFHRSLYRAVEATSATPFATRSRDRGLHAAFVSALRMTVPYLRSDVGVKTFEATSPDVEAVRTAFVDRARTVADSATAEATSRDLAAIAGAWEAALRPPEPVTSYSSRGKPDASLLINASELLADVELAERGRLETPWATPMSMRDVDAETALRPARPSYRAPSGSTDGPAAEDRSEERND